MWMEVTIFREKIHPSHRHIIIAYTNSTGSNDHKYNYTGFLSVRVYVLAVKIVSLDVGGYLILPLVSIAEQLLFVIEQFLMCLS